MSVEIKDFGTLPDGRAVHAYTLKGKGNLELTASDYGCRILHLYAPDRDGKMGDMLLGHNALSGYLGKNFQGSMIGRVGNRIGGARFTLEGREYALAKNDGENSLHGGPGGFQPRQDAAEVFAKDRPEGSRRPGEEGIPQEEGGTGLTMLAGSAALLAAGLVLAGTFRRRG